MRTILFDAVLLLAGGAFGAVILVPADQPTIAAAIAVSTAIDQIEIAPGTYTESNLVISHDLTIRSPYGTDPSLCVVQAAPTPGTATNRVFAVIAGRVTIDGLTIRNGGGTVHGAGVGAGGGTILSLSNCRIVDNRTTSGNGGGVYSTNGYLSLWQCTVSGNTSTGNGGGVSVSGSDLNMTDCTVEFNQTGMGGGLYVLNAPAWISSCTFSQNTATGGSGAGGIGVSLALSGDTVNLTNVTVSGNAALSGGGGGIDAAVAAGNTMALSHVTVASNAAASGAGGGIRSSGAVAPDLSACLVAYNMAPSGTDISGAVNSLDYNLIQYVAGATITGVTTHNVTGADPGIGLLADNGGKTRTHALLPGSAALDQIPPLALLQTWDQRQAPRPQNVDGDIGAYELFVEGWGATMINMWQQPPPDNDTIQLMVSFNQLAINFNDISDLIITTTGTLTYTGASGFAGGMNFAVTLEGVSGTGTIQVSVNTASDIVTPFGAPLTTSVTSLPFASDNDPPLIGISLPSVASTLTGPVEYTVSYVGEDTVTLTESDITLDTTGMVSATVSVSPAKDQDYVVTLSDIAGQGTLGFTIAPGTAVDAAGNLAEGASSTVQVTVGTVMPLMAWPAAAVLLALGAALARRRR